ncbi:MAG TPA: hypothetical protein VIM10_04185 [Actinopolymorphaceae bacterium]|jgi:hypothetical protein
MTTSLVSAPIANPDGDIERSSATWREVFARINRADFTRWGRLLLQKMGGGGWFG